MELNRIYNEDCLETMSRMPDNFIDLVVTSPPYDDLRSYQGYTFEFEKIAQELFRIIKQGGVVVWVVGDQTINGSETGTSFRQALYFMQCGFKLHDTMIWNKRNCSSIGSENRYENVFEYMFILSKSFPATVNIIKDRKNERAGEIQHSSIRQNNGTVIKTSGYGKTAIAEFGRRRNVWDIFPAKSHQERLHPAVFPLKLAKDHILSWSSENQTVYDPFSGSGTTAVAAIKLNRNFIASEISEEYCKIAQQRIDLLLMQPTLF